MCLMCITFEQNRTNADEAKKMKQETDKNSMQT